MWLIVLLFSVMSLTTVMLYSINNFEKERSNLVALLCNVNNPSPIVTINDVLKSLQAIEPGKSAGPDRISGSLLKLCKEPLSPIFCKLFQQSIDSCSIPVIWKTAEIIPVPRKSPPICNNDYRPVALTSIVMKCFERMMVTLLRREVVYK